MVKVAVAQSMRISKYMEGLRAALDGWTDETPPSESAQLRVVRDIVLAKQALERESMRRRDWLSGTAQAWRPPVQPCGASRYQRRLNGLTYREIAEQDGVTDGAVWLSIRWYASRTALPLPEPPAEAVSVSALAAALDVRKETVHEWAGRGLIPSVQRGKHRRFMIDAVRAALTAQGWEPGGKLYGPDNPRGRMVLARRAERDTGVHACGTCHRAFPRDHYPPSAGRGMGFQCRDCSRPGRRAADARRRQQKGSTQVEPVSHVLVAERDGWRCAICRGEVTRETWSLDHVVPLSKGGAHTYANVVLAHRSCNVRRGAGRFPVQGPLFATPSGSPCR